MKVLTMVMNRQLIESFRRGTVFISAGIAICLLSACALILHGPTQIVPFSSTPAGAEVFIDGESRGFTPLELELARNRSYEVILRFGDQEQKLNLINVPEGGNIALDVIPAGAAGTLTLVACISPSDPNLPPDFKTLICGGGALITALIGTPIYVDAATGAWYQLSPGEVSVTFSQ